MRKNRKTTINGRRVVLVPYKPEHVPKYHRWMQNKELQQLTASEPLSLQQEYDMQNSWLQDENKCTFIVVDAAQYDASNNNDIASMVGDVNLFFNDLENRHVAEVEIMIAEPESRGKGLGREALLAMIHYGMYFLGIETVSAKIGCSNQPSLNMFSKIGFKEISRSEAFQEVTLEWQLTAEVKEWLLDQTKHLIVIDSEL